MRIRFGDEVNGEQRMLVWNLFQKWAAKNEVVVLGKAERGKREIAVSIALKRRLGKPMNKHPAA